MTVKNNLTRSQDEHNIVFSVTLILINGTCDDGVKKMKKRIKKENLHINKRINVRSIYTGAVIHTNHL